MGARTAIFGPGVGEELLDFFAEGVVLGAVLEVHRVSPSFRYQPSIRAMRSRSARGEPSQARSNMVRFTQN